MNRSRHRTLTSTAVRAAAVAGAAIALSVGGAVSASAAEQEAAAPAAASAPAAADDAALMREVLDDPAGWRAGVDSLVATADGRARAEAVLGDPARLASTQAVIREEGVDPGALLRYYREAVAEPLAPSPAGGSTAPTGVEQAAVDQTNAKRASVGCPPVTVDDRLTAAARDHAQEMVRERYFAHTSPSGETAFDRAKRFGVTWEDHIGENIELGAEGDGAAAIDAFWNETPPDDGHRRAIADCSYTRVGIGYDPGQALPDYSAGTWVQLLAT